jgi:membrane complex biogenesis BtpA family protein
MSDWLPTSLGAAKPVIGMLHAPPLPGAPRYGGDWPAVRELVLRDAEALMSGGVHGLMLENYGDVPFFPGRVPTHVAASLTALALAVKQRFDVPLGINVLRNDGQTALAVALAAGAQFIRVNILCGARLTDQGIIQGIAHDLLRLRRELGAEDVRILADVNVKHSAPLACRPLEEEINDLLTRGGADGLIVSGVATGRPIEADELQHVYRAAAGRSPVLVGSGVSSENLAALAPHADAFIVGTSLKQDGRPENPVDPQRVRTIVNSLRRVDGAAG